MSNNVALDSNTLSVIQLHANECNYSLVKPLNAIGQTMFFMADGMFKQYIRKELNKIVSDIMMYNPDDALFSDEDISIMSDDELIEYLSAHTEPTLTDDANNKFYLVESYIITPSKEFKVIGGYVMHPKISTAEPLKYDRFFSGDVFEYFGLPIDFELNDLIIIPIFRGWDLKVVTRQQSLIKKYAQLNNVLNVCELDIIDDRIDMIQKDLVAGLNSIASARAEQIVDIATAHNIKLTEADVFANLDSELLVRFMNGHNVTLVIPVKRLKDSECSKINFAKSNIDKEYRADPKGYFQRVAKDYHTIETIATKYDIKISKAEIRRCSGSDGLIAYINSQIAKK